MIQDPGAGLETREERRAARLAVWVPWWRDASAEQKKDIVWDAFTAWYRALDASAKGRLQAKVRAGMGDPDATLEQMKDWVYDSLSARQLTEVMAWLS